MRLMMQALLADRFHLVVHYKTSEAPVFGLVLVRAGITGPNLQPHTTDEGCSAGAQLDQPAASQNKKPSTLALADLPPVCGVIAHVPSSENPTASYGGRGISLSLLAQSLPTMTGVAAVPRPVVDQTGLTGVYDFSLHWAHSTADADRDDNSAAIREALKNQLGLRLKSTHAPMNILIIDHVEHPSDN